MSHSESDEGDVPTNGFIIMNRKGIPVFRHGLNPPAHHQGSGTSGTLDLERLQSVILQNPAAPIGCASVRLFQKHAEGDDEEEDFAVSYALNYDKVWDTERTEDSGSEARPSEAPEDDVGYTQEVFLLVGIISDEEDHSGDMGCEHGCPLQRNVWIVHMPAGIAWADLKGLVTDLSTGTSKMEMMDAIGQIDYAKGLMDEWSDLIEVDWLDETGEDGENVEVCRILLEVREHDPDVFPPWSDTFDDGATNLRRIEFAYHPSSVGDGSRQNAVVGQDQVDSAPAGANQEQPRPAKLSSPSPNSAIEDASKGDVALTKQPLACEDADINAKDSHDCAALIFAAQEGRHAELQLLLNQKGTDVDCRDSVGRTILSLAAWRGHDAVVRLLLGRMDPDIKDSDGMTPLMHAAQWGCDSAVTILLDHGANINSQDNDGYTALILAARDGHHAVIQLLLSRGIDVNRRDNSGTTALGLAAWNGHLEATKLLAEFKGVDINSKDNAGLSPLASAATFGHAATVKALLGYKGIDVNSRSNGYQGLTPLGWAAKKGYTPAAKALLEHNGVDAKVKDSLGRTPLFLAAQGGHKSCVQMLIGREDVVANSDDVSAALSAALKKGNRGIVQLLTPLV